MKKIFKSRMIMWVSILALLVVAVGGTLALMYTRANSVTNTFTVGAVDTEINEVLTDGNKQVSIKNYGTAPAYVRAQILVSGISSENVEIVSEEPSGEALSTEPGKNTVYLVMPNTVGDSASWKRNTSAEYIDYTDDYYYYLGVLDPKVEDKVDSTTDLLKKVVLGNDLAGNEQFLANFNVTIYHESVQAIGNGTSLQNVVDAFNNAEVGSGAGESTT